MIVDIEPWSRFYPDCLPLMHAHKLEVREIRHSLDVNVELATALEAANALVILTGREMDTLCGYISWYVSPSLESRTLMCAQMGPWYVRPEHRDTSLGGRLWQQSKIELRRRGIFQLFPHHYQHGAGTGLGRHFIKEGAELVESVYSLWIGQGENVKWPA